jgi:hypothetical protein
MLESEKDTGDFSPATMEPWLATLTIPMKTKPGKMFPANLDDAMRSTPAFFESDFSSAVASLASGNFATPEFISEEGLYIVPSSPFGPRIFSRSTGVPSGRVVVTPLNEVVLVPPLIDVVVVESSGSVVEVESVGLDAYTCRVEVATTVNTVSSAVVLRVKKRTLVFMMHILLKRNR